MLIAEIATTGTGYKDEVIAIAVIDALSGDPVYGGLFSSSRPIPEVLAASHGLSAAILADKPRFLDETDKIKAVIAAHESESRGLVFFDARSKQRFIEKIVPDGIPVLCAMRRFSTHHNGRGWPSLDVAAGTAGYHALAPTHPILAGAQKARLIWLWCDRHEKYSLDNQAFGKLSADTQCRLYDSGAVSMGGSRGARLSIIPDAYEMLKAETRAALESRGVVTRSLFAEDFDALRDL